MSTNLDDALRFQSTALNLRAYRQQILASNIANSDTPAFKARDIDFSAALESAVAERGGPAAVQLATTSARHMQGAAGVSAAASLQYRVPVQASVDGNSVEMDVERAQFADNAVHYEANLTILGMEIKQLLAAIQG